MKNIDDLYRAYRLFKRKTDNSELTPVDWEILRHYAAAGENGLTVFELIAKLLGRALTEQEEDRICELDQAWSAETGEPPATCSPTMQ